MLRGRPICYSSYAERNIKGKTLMMTYGMTMQGGKGRNKAMACVSPNNQEHLRISE